MSRGLSEAASDSGLKAGIGWRHRHYRELLERQPTLDFLEVHSENFFARGGAALALLERGRQSYPVSLHGVGLSLGSAIGIDDWHLDQLASLVQRIEPIRVSDHACFSRAARGTGIVHAADLLPLPFSHEALDVLCVNVQKVQDRLNQPFMVENLSAYIAWKQPYRDDEAEALLSEVDFLVALSRRTGCSLLVDVNNIYVNALNAQIAGDPGDPATRCMEWLDAIPASCVGELHVAGHCHVNNEHGNIVIDDHCSRVCEPVWQIYQHAVRRFGQVPTLIEWDTDVPALDVLLDEADRARAVARTVTQPGRSLHHEHEHE